MDHSHHVHMNNEIMNHEMSNDMSGHDHSHMGHMDSSCNMNMLFTWSTKNLCIIFRWWRISGPLTLVFSLLGVIAVTALFEAVRAGSRRYEQWVKMKKDREPINVITESPPIRSAGQRLFSLHRRTHIIKAIIYAIQSFYGLMLMLIFMTYNGWVMLSMAVGSFLGYLVFGGDTSATKDGACH